MRRATAPVTMSGTAEEEDEGEEEKGGSAASRRFSPSKVTRSIDLFRTQFEFEYYRWITASITLSSVLRWT